MTMQLVQKYNYRKLERIDAPEGRRYVVDESCAVPSVTTILDKTSDKSFLSEWVARVGEAEAERIRNEAASIGTGMHNYLEGYILGDIPKTQFMSQTLAKLIIKKGLVNVSDIWGTEVMLYIRGLYAGTTDLVAVHNGIPSIIDFKNSRTAKKVEHIDSYRAQIAAYAMAHNDMFGTDICRGVIMVANRDAKYQEFIFEGAEFDRCIELWLNSLDKYYEISPNFVASEPANLINTSLGA